MECDVIPDCSQDVDPLGNLENCDSLSDESCSYGGALNAQIISSTSYVIHSTTTTIPSTGTSTITASSTSPSSSSHRKTTSINDTESSRRKTSLKNNHTTTLKKSLARVITNNNASSASSSGASGSNKQQQPPPLAPFATTGISSQFLLQHPNAISAAAVCAATAQASTMREVLASIPGFSLKPRRRTNKKMSTAAQIEQTREGCIDLETPDSILCGANLRSLLNKHTFSMLPPLYQYKLVQLLPNVDRPPIDPESPTIRLNSSSLNNEFFARACLEWRERLSEGEFTPENQLKLRAEAEKEKSKLDPWKLKHFEPIWGDGQAAASLATQSGQSHKSPIKIRTNGERDSADVPATTATSTATSNTSYTTSSGRIVKNPISYTSSSYCPKRTRTVGAVTRSTAASSVAVPAVPDNSTKSTVPMPELIPIRTKTPIKILDQPVEMTVDQSDDTNKSSSAVIDQVDSSNNEQLTVKEGEQRKEAVELKAISTLENLPCETTSIPPTAMFTISSDIETKPIDSNQSPKRAVKRSASPELASSKLSKMSNVIPVDISCNAKAEMPNDAVHLNKLHIIDIQVEPLAPTTVNTDVGFDAATVAAANDVIENVSNISIMKADSDNLPQLTDVTIDTIGSGQDHPIKNENKAILQSREPSSSSSSNSTMHIMDNIKLEDDLHIYSVESTIAGCGGGSGSGADDYNDEPQLLQQQIIDKFDSSDNLSNFCTNDGCSSNECDNIFKIQNFEGVLQIQPNVLTLESAGVGTEEHVITSLVVNDVASSINMIGAEQIVDDSCSNSDDVLVDCNGENSGDTAEVEELEPTIQNLEPLEDDPIEQKFTDAENYVLESGEISADSGEANSVPLEAKICVGDDIQADIFAAAMARAFESVPGNVPVAMAIVDPTENTEIIPMEETLEVRLKESTYQVVSEWPYNIKMENILESPEQFSVGNNCKQMGNTLMQSSSSSSGGQSTMQPTYSTASQVKLELEVTLTPEAEVTSTVTTSNSFCDSDQSNEDMKTNSSNSSNSNSGCIPTVIPPTTIVCLPSMVSLPNSIAHQSSSLNIQSTYITSLNQKQGVQQQHSQSHPHQAVFTVNSVQRPSVSLSLPPSGSTQQHRTAVVASSSSLPYLTLATTQPLRAVPHTTQSRHKIPIKGGRGSRTNSNRPPPGAVNLERSYQICQAVIQNSPNRHQLKAQLRPPPSMLGPTTNTANKKDENNSTSNKMTNVQQRVAFTKKGGFVQRQPSPVLLRHVFTTNQGIPVSMAVLPSGIHQSQSQQQQQSQPTNQQNLQGAPDSSQLNVINQSGQYILVQRAGIVPTESPAPRASSAPPAQNQQPHGVSGVPISGRGRPASVDVESQNEPVQVQHYIEVNTSGLQTVTKKVPHQGFVYGGDISVDATFPHYSVSGENTPPNCSCSLNAMVICQQCGVFCHDECMGTSKLCLSCVIR